MFKSRRNLWIISERGVDARDNGYFFFKFLKNTYPDKPIKYVISKDSPDFYKFINQSDDVVEYRSFSHYLHLAEASHLISTHIHGYSPDIFVFSSLEKYFKIFRNKKRVFLQHGIIKDDIPSLYANCVNLDLFISGATGEFNYLVNHFRYPPGIIQYTGLCRYDNLLNFNAKKQVLLMPTWRASIDKSRFEDSNYFKVYSNLLQSKELHDILQKNGYTLVFYPHFEVQSNILSFKKLALPDYVQVSGFERDVQDLLKESALLITDYSSVYFDMAYMHKPIILYQFDKQDYHYNQGYFDVENIGILTVNEEEVLRSLEFYFSKGCIMLDNHSKYVDDFFYFHDDKNCERVYNAIINLN